MRTTRSVSVLAALAMGMLVGCGGGDDGVGSGSEDLTEIPKDGTPEAAAVLDLVNDREISVDVLDDDVGLDARAARDIIAHRDGADGTPGTDDDDGYNDIKELDQRKYVGGSAFKKMLAYAKANGYFQEGGGGDPSVEVIFSPQPWESSHNARIAQLINEATTSLDIAMYSFSDAAISDAIEAAVQRGVQVRMVFESANADRRVSDVDERGNTKSGRLEKMGVNVRYVNKIMHHKWVIIDGPRDDAAAADTARLVSGSGNWSNGAATRYDENTLFMSGQPEIAFRLQREFNLMWEHSREFELADAKDHTLSTLEITDEMIGDDPTVGAVFTSDNFNVSGSTFSVTDSNEISDALVAAIHAAQDRIHIASGHLRSRPVSEALIGKRQVDPDIDIQVYLDGQEYISEWYHSSQEDKRASCLASASSESAIRKCNDKGFLFGYQVGNSNIDVKYKYYAYRWDFSYAVQMHNKFLIIDDALWTGSYNLSDNAEHGTLENMMVFDGPEYEALVEQYEDKFQSLWGTGEGLLPGLEAQVQGGSDFPIVFEAMSLTWDEVTGLKELIRNNCPDINTDAYRRNAASHKYCEL